MEVMKPVQGTHFLVSGAGAWIRSKIYWTEDTIFAGAELGYARIRVSGEKIEITMMGLNQKVLYVYRIE